MSQLGTSGLEKVGSRAPSDRCGCEALKPRGGKRGVCESRRHDAEGARSAGAMAVPTAVSAPACALVHSASTAGGAAVW
jgi:hypothetical protein